MLEGEGRARRRGADDDDPAARAADATWSASEQRRDAAIARRRRRRGELPVFPRPIEPERPTSPKTSSRPVPVDAAEAPPLPHWTEPPTGQLPGRVRRRDDDDDEDLSAWASFGGPTRFRSEGSDWSEADFDELGELGGEETTRLGALADAPPPDDDEAFAAQVAARRRRGGSRPRPAVEAEPDDETAARVERARPAAGAAHRRRDRRRLADLPAPRAHLRPCVLAARHRRPERARARQRRCGCAATTRDADRAARLGRARVRGRSTTARPRIPVFFALTDGVLDAVVPVEGHARAARSAASRARCSRSATSACSAASPGCCCSRATASASSLGTAICTVAYDVIGYFFGSQFGRSRIAPERVAEQDGRGHARRLHRGGRSSGSSIVGQHPPVGQPERRSRSASSSAPARSSATCASR